MTTSKFTVGQSARINAAHGVPSETGTLVKITAISTVPSEPWPIRAVAEGMDAADYFLLAENELDAAKPTLADTLKLPPQGRVVLNHMKKQGSISAADAMLTYGMTSAVLTRRVCDIENIGFVVNRESKRHPTTGRRYTRYSLAA